MRFTITAFWDSESGVWVASNDELGLATWAKTIEELRRKIHVLVPEAIELNGITPEDESVPYDLLLHENQRTPIHP
ncbi:MAG: DUF1902 domain-containing protein [Nitrosospira sp.]|nr:DUF1902 domain-containing protein [Nitrosospira sp.]